MQAQILLSGVFPPTAPRAASGQVVVGRDPGGLRPDAQGFRSARLARLAGLWVAEPGCVYPGRVLPEQMGTCQCYQPGTGPSGR